MGHTYLEAYAEGAGHGPERAGSVQMVVPHSCSRGSLGPAGCDLVPQTPPDLQQVGHPLGLMRSQVVVTLGGSLGPDGHDIVTQAPADQQQG